MGIQRKCLDAMLYSLNTTLCNVYTRNIHMGIQDGYTGNIHMGIQRKCLDAMLYSVTQHCVMCIQWTCNCKYMYKVMRYVLCSCSL